MVAPQQNGQDQLVTVVNQVQIVEIAAYVCQNQVADNIKNVGLAVSTSKWTEGFKVASTAPSLVRQSAINRCFERFCIAATAHCNVGCGISSYEACRRRCLQVCTPAFEHPSRAALPLIQRLLPSCTASMCVFQVKGKDVRGAAKIHCSV